jgi:hypothetical protein
MSDIRDLSSHEREVLEFLLQGEWDGAATLRAQLSTVTHAWSTDEANASFALAIDKDAPRAAADLAKAPKLDDLFLKVEDGVLIGVQCNRSSLPRVDELAA